MAIEKRRHFCLNLSFLEVPKSFNLRQKFLIDWKTHKVENLLGRKYGQKISAGVCTLFLALFSHFWTIWGREKVYLLSVFERPKRKSCNHLSFYENSAFLFFNIRSYVFGLLWFRPSISSFLKKSFQYINQLKYTFSSV